MAVLIVMFLATVIAYGVIPENKELPCNGPNNFKLKICETNKTLCINMVDKEYKFKINDCMTEKDFNEMKSYAEDNKQNVILEKRKDDFPVTDRITPNLECWTCKATGNRRDGTHPCNDQKNFQLKKCEKDEKMCIDIVVKDEKYLGKDCLSEQQWNKMKSHVKDDLKATWEICNTTQCNTKKWKDWDH